MLSKKEFKIFFFIIIYKSEIPSEENDEMYGINNMVEDYTYLISFENN